MYIDDIAANYCRTVQCGMMVIFLSSLFNLDMRWTFYWISFKISLAKNEDNTFARLIVIKWTLLQNDWWSTISENRRLIDRIIFFFVLVLSAYFSMIVYLRLFAIINLTVSMPLLGHRILFGSVFGVFLNFYNIFIPFISCRVLFFEFSFFFFFYMHVLYISLSYFNFLSLLCLYIDVSA